MSAVISIQTQNELMPTAKTLYGIFLEDINRAIDGGLYPEMLRNRTFEDSVLPEGCTSIQDDYAFVTESGWRDEFNHGEGLTKWIREGAVEPTRIPAWYARHARMELDSEQVLNQHRSRALRVEFEENGRIRNVGFFGISVKEGEKYHLYFFAKGSCGIEISVRDESDKNLIGTTSVDTDNYRRFDFEFTASHSMNDGVFEMKSSAGGELILGFISMMPVDTFMGHGLRKDIAEKLAALKPGFFRFPGGCIVEGFTRSTAMRFANTVGPVWERPGHLLMWHYRSYDAIGFHEYLQFCEDLDMEPIYVCNCGMTCQARKEVYMEGAEQDEMLQDLMNALEYAMGTPDSKWGSLRAQMGHPAPFPIHMIEIGNENWGDKYEERYLRWYRAIKEKYPDMICIANCHVEKHDCPADGVDEHYYDTAEWFAENQTLFDSYDRKGPRIFLGEVAVVRGYTGQLYGAIAEGAFFTGVEKNQDMVGMAAYAPLLENVGYKAWFPNLIRFNNHESLAIPSYYVWKLFGEHRGDTVVEEETRTDRFARPVKGLMCLYGQPGLKITRPRLDGNEVPVTHELLGKVVAEGKDLRIDPADEDQKKEASRYNAPQRDVLVVFGDEVPTSGRLEFDFTLPKGQELEVGFFPYRMPDIEYVSDETNPPAEWNVENVKSFLFKTDGHHITLRDEMGSSPDHPSVLEDKDIELFDRDCIHRLTFETDLTSMKIMIDGVTAVDREIPSLPAISGCATLDHEEGQVIVKVVNMSDQIQQTQIRLDCDVEDTYQVCTVSGSPVDMNTFEDPEKIHDVSGSRTGAGREFVFEAPPHSANVLLLKQINS